MKYLITILFMIPIISACTKDDAEIMKQARQEIAGTYDIVRIDVTTYDPSGNILSTSSINDPGVIELTLNSSGIDDENWIDFPATLMDLTVSFGKLRDSRYFYWAADPAKKRFMIWGIDLNGASVHVTFSERITNELVLLYTESNNSSSPLENTLSRKEFFELKKR
jgi:hypothetical protein